MADLPGRKRTDTQTQLKHVPVFLIFIVKRVQYEIEN